MRVLIVGAGIAGPTLAYWLVRHGFAVSLVERAPELRRGGYVIDFGGLGYDVAAKMDDLVPRLRESGYLLREVRYVDSKGRRVAGTSVDSFLRVTGGRYITIARADLAAQIFGLIEGRVETIFGDTVAAIEETPADVRVTFASGTARDFDLVVGSDGVHSEVRRIAFGPQERFERYLGICAAAYTLTGYAPRDELVYVLYSEIGRQAARFALRDDRTLVLLTFRDPQGAPPAGREEQNARLRRAFSNAGWECATLLAPLDRVADLYFDRVSQIRFAAGEPWHRGRVVLLGDAASCVSLLAGEGSSLAMAAAYILAGELAGARGAVPAALCAYEERFRRFVESKQRTALRFASSFAPTSRFSMLARNIALDLMSVPWMGDRIVAAMLQTGFALPSYDD